MNFDDWKTEFLIMLEYHKEVISIELHLGYKKMINRGYDKYKDFTDNQLILIRNHLYSKMDKIEKKLNEYKGN